MKPVKNRYFCHDCGYAKMRFETEKAALRFIEYNADEIAKENKGRAPQRAYYCSLCCAWHVTSRRRCHNYTSYTELWMSGMGSQIETIKKRKKEKAEKCQKDPAYRLEMQIKNCMHEIATAQKMLQNNFRKNARIAFDMAAQILNEASETQGFQQEKMECLHQLEKLQPMLQAG